MTILESLYQCNHCGKEMKHKTPKLVMGEFDGENFEKLDIHICQDCRPNVIDYANGKTFTVPRKLMTREWKAAVGRTTSHVPVDAGDVFKAEAEAKKTHKFLGNQFYKVDKTGERVRRKK